MVSSILKRTCSLLATNGPKAPCQDQLPWSLSVGTSHRGPSHEPNLTDSSAPIESCETRRPTDITWEWDGSLLTVRTNRWAFTPIYYVPSGQGIFFSTSLQDVAGQADSLSLDHIALAVRLRLGSFVREDTPFEEIKVLPPGGILKWSIERLHIEGQYWVPIQTSMKRDKALDAYIELFRHAVQKRSRSAEPFVLPLSGGRDSRHILFELNRAGHLPETCLTTYEFPPYSTLEDIRIAKLLSSRLELPHEIVDQPRRGLPMEVLKNKCTDLGSSEHSWTITLAERMGGLGSTIWDGIGGDFLSGGAQMDATDLRLYDAQKYEDVAGRILNRWGIYPGFDQALRRITQPELSEKMSLKAALTRVGDTLAELSGAPNPLAAFYFWHRARRGIALAPFRIYPQYGIQAICPYLDEELYSHLGALPPSFTLDKQFHTEAIARAFPEFQDIPYASKKVLYKKWPGYVQRTLVDLAFYLGANSTGHIIDANFAVPRLLQSAVSSRASLSSWLAPMTMLMLCQLEELVQSARHPQRSE